MQRARATKSDQGKVARVQAALDGHQAHAPGHALVDHGQHRLGGLLQTEVHLCAQALHRSAGTFHIQAGAVAVHAAVGVDAPQHHIGIGHGGFGAAAAISHGAGHGACTARAHLQHAAPVEVGNAAPARANGVHIDHGQAHGNAKVQVGELGHLGFAVDDDGHIKTGAPHVTGDHMAEARLGGNAGCGRDPSRRAGAHDVGGALAELAQGRDATVGLHDGHFALIAPALELVGQVAGIARHQGL